MTKTLYDSPFLVKEKDIEEEMSQIDDITDSAENESFALVSAIDADSCRIQSSPTLIGTCLDIEHPSLSNRFLIQWRDVSGKQHEAWLPCLKDIKPARHDRVLLQQPDNWFEPIISGVLDGLSGPKEPEPKPGPALTLEKHKALHVLDSDDKPILQIEQGEKGPILRLLDDDLNIEVKGRLRFSARDIELAARKGGVKIQATDDVVVKGEIIYLN